MSSRLVKQQLAAFLAAGGGVRKHSQQQYKKVTGEEGKVDKESGKVQQKLNLATVPISEAAKKRRSARKRKGKKQAQNVPTESVRERNLRLLNAGAQPHPELEDLLAKVTGAASAKGAEDEEESDFDDLDF